MRLDISFKDRPISKAPLEVLQHLYYYTAQYGLSVAQFTGAHQKFWENLPRALKKAKSSERELESLVRKLEEYSAGSQKRLLKRRDQKDSKWAEKEIVINAQLISVLAAFPDELLSLGFKELTGEPKIPKSVKIVDLVLKKEDGSSPFVFVEPDVLLLGDNHLIMVEVKTRGWSKSSRKYPPSQLLNYFRLIAECQDASKDGLPKEFSHLILVPSSYIKWLENHSDWVLNPRDANGRMIVDPGGCIKSGSGKSSYDHERVRDLLREVPIYYRTWEEIETSFQTAISKYDDKKNNSHWKSLCGDLAYLSNKAGKYK